METTPSTLIVGYGITGKNLHREIAALNPDICDLRQIINFNNHCKKSL